MNAILDASVQFIQVGLMMLVLVVCFGLWTRLKRVEEKLDAALKQRGT